MQFRSFCVPFSAGGRTSSGKRTGAGRDDERRKPGTGAFRNGRLLPESGGNAGYGENDGGKKYALLALDYIEKHYGGKRTGTEFDMSYLNIGSSSRFNAILKASGEKPSWGLPAPTDAEGRGAAGKHRSEKLWEILLKGRFRILVFQRRRLQRATGKSTTGTPGERGGCDEKQREKAGGRRIKLPFPASEPTCWRCFPF